MTDTTSQPEIAEQLSEQGLQKVTGSETLEDVNTTLPQNMMSGEVAEISTSLPQNTTSDVVLDESSRNDHGKMIYTTAAPPESQEQNIASISSTVAQNTVSNVVLNEADKPDGSEIVYTATTTQETQDNQDVVGMSTTIPQHSQDVVGISTTMSQDNQDVVGISPTMPQVNQNVVGISAAMPQNNQDDVGSTTMPQINQDIVGINTTMPQHNQEVVGVNTSMPQGNQNVIGISTTMPHDNQDVVGISTTMPQDSQAVVGISTTMPQNTVANVVLHEAKSDAAEMVFTVVAMDNNISDLMQINPENLPKEVQLSLVQPQPPSNSNLATNSDQLSDINQLALIAASIEENPRGSGTIQEELPVVQMENPSPQGKQDSPIKSVKGRVLCTICDQDFSDLPSMRRHRLIHYEEKPYKCDFCDKSFRRKDNLREHRNIHTQENVYKCERCGKTFPRKYTHKVHMSRFCGKAGQAATGSESWGSPDKATNVKPGVVTKSSEPCHICFKTFRDASTLKRHLLTHSDERPYKCTECDKAFRRKDHLQEHVIVHKLVRPFSCQTCGKSFSRKNGLKTHMIRTTHLLGFDDIITPGQSKGPGDVEVHVVEQVLAADQLVTSSSEVFSETSQGDDGLQTACQPTPHKDVNETKLQTGETDTPTVPLDFSQVPTNSENSMDDETTVVLSEKSAEPTDLKTAENGAPPETCALEVESDTVKAFLCPTCNAAFAGKDDLWEHFQEHLEENVFACRHCFQIFTSTELLEDHQKSCDGEEGDCAMRNDSQFSEDDPQGSADQTANATVEQGGAFNDETLTTPNSKKRKRINTPERTDQTCTICNKVFRDATALKRHSLVHSGERPHACNHCEKRFRRRDHLKAHETAHHSGITSHECKTCDAAFNTRYALTVHVKTCKNRPSSPKEPISEEVKLIGSPESKECPICHKVFKDPSTQRRHFRIHSDERPFHCEVCSKSFRRKDNLKEHLLCHSYEKPFSCDHCGKSLSRRSSLTNHMNVCPARKSLGASSMTNTATENPVIPNVQFTEPSVQDVCISGDPQEISAAHLLATGLTSSLVSSSDIASLDVTSTEMTSSEMAPIEEDIEHGLREEDDGSGNSFPCEECGKIFRAKWTLRFHQRIHTGEKPYTCKTCDRQFRQASHLKIHERTHSGERPYHCQICGRAFIDSSTMKRHERLHKDAADPNAIIDEQPDVIASEEAVINTQDDVIKSQEYVISSQVINDPNEASIVQQAVEVSIADEGAIQLLVTTANSELANSAQPISTNVVAGMNQSETRLDESNLGQILRECIRNQGVEKIETLEDWQQNHPSESVEQLIYIETEEPSETE